MQAPEEMMSYVLEVLQEEMLMQQHLLKHEQALPVENQYQALYTVPLNLDHLIYNYDIKLHKTMY